MSTQKITPFLWFDGNAEEAANFYVSTFKNSRVTSAPVGPDGKVMMVTFELDGQAFYAINGGPMFKFTEAISMFVACEDQAEVDDLWAKLTADGGQPGQCGWLKDRYGLSWQIIPTALHQLISDPDRAKGQRVMAAMMQMVKIDIAALQKAYQG